MSCQQLKDIVLYGGLIVAILSFVMSLMINRKLKKVVKEHSIDKEKLKGPVESLPPQVQEAIKSVKVAFVISLVIILGWAISLVIVLEKLC